LRQCGYFGAEFVDDGIAEINKLENQVTALQTRPFIEGRKIDADAANNYLYRLTNGKLKPPYKVGTMVEDVKDKLYCLEDINDAKPGNWMTDKKTFSSLDEARALFPFQGFPIGY